MIEVIPVVIKIVLANFQSMRVKRIKQNHVLHILGDTEPSDEYKANYPPAFYLKASNVLIEVILKVIKKVSANF